MSMGHEHGAWQESPQVWSWFVGGWGMTGKALEDVGILTDQSRLPQSACDGFVEKFTGSGL